MSFLGLFSSLHKKLYLCFLVLNLQIKPTEDLDIVSVLPSVMESLPEHAQYVVIFINHFYLFF